MTTPSPVPDIRIVQDLNFPAYQVTTDWSLRSDGTLDDTEALATGVIVALGSNALAAPSDPLPNPDSTDLCGWWGDLDCDTIWGAWPIGSKLWLLRRSSILPVQAQQGSTVAKVQSYIQLALQPFLTNKICSKIDVNAMQIGRERIDATVVIYRGSVAAPMPAINLLYSILWTEFAAQAQVKLLPPPYPD